MTMTALFGFLGAVAGASHALLLAHGVRYRRRFSTAVLRFVMTPVILAVAARSGMIVTAAIAWALGFALAAIVQHRRMA